MSAVSREEQALYHEREAEKELAAGGQFAANNARWHRLQAWVQRSPDGTPVPIEDRPRPCQCGGCECHDFRCTGGSYFTLDGRLVCDLCYNRAVSARNER